MRPVVDSQGRVWFGEMNRNYLGSFDPHTGQFWQQTPPGGKFGIMGIAVAPDDTIWFAEQYGDYIGHYFPKTGEYQLHPLPTLHVPDPTNPGQTTSLPSAPNDIFLDTHGDLWFTEINANAIGRLHTADGSLKIYPLAHTPTAPSSNPYGITGDPQGHIWFTTASNRLGELNPIGGTIRYFTPPNVTATLMEVASDNQGTIWSTTFGNGLLLKFEPAEASFTTYNVPASSGGGGGLYGIVAAHDNTIWVAVTSGNRLAHFDARTGSFVTYTIPTQNSLPIGVAEDEDKTIWFTESESDKIGRLNP